MSVETQPNACPDCGKVSDRTTGIDSPRPKEGDVSICFYCGCLALFTSDRGIRLPTPEELAELDADARLQRILRAVRADAARRTGRWN